MAEDRDLKDSRMQNDEEQTEEVVKFLKEVRATVDKNVKAILDDEIKQITKEYTEREKLSLKKTSEFIVNLGNNGTMTLETMQQIIRILLLCLDNQEFADTIYKEITVDEDKEITVDEDKETEMPVELKGMDNEAVALYAKALTQGYEKVRRIRLMVVGMFKVGKTSLVNNLVEDLSNEKQPSSTEGIDVNLCHIDGQNRWKKVELTRKSQDIKRFIKAKNDLECKETHQINTEEPLDIKKEEMLKTVHQDTVEQPAPAVNSSFEDTKKRVIERQNQPEVKELLQMFEEIKAEPKDDEMDASKAVSSDEETLISVWDFAGQILYYSTHHFFLNKRSIYLLLMDMTKDLNTPVEESDSLSGLLNKNCTSLEAFKFWLSSIHMYSSIHDQEHKVQATVILVGTHKDQMKCKEEDKEDQMEEYFEKALEPFVNNSEIMQHIHGKRFLVNNCTEGDPAFNELRAEVKRLAEKQQYWNEISPASFVQLEKSFDNMRAKGDQLVFLRDVQDANKNNIKPVDDEELSLFLELQHLFGNILHFNKAEQLCQYVILAPQWIIAAFKCFITHKGKPWKPEQQHLWNYYKDYAIIKTDLMKEIIESSNNIIGNHGEALVKYMEHLNIMSKPVKIENFEEENVSEMADDCSRSNTNVVEKLNINDFHIVPCQLKAKPSKETFESLTCPKDWQRTPALCFVFIDNFMPPAVFHRLLAACIRQWKIAKQTNNGKEETLMFNGLAVFKTCERSQLRLWYIDHIIYARMTFMPEKDAEPESAIDRRECQNVRIKLYSFLMAILDLLPRSKHITKATPFEENIQCPNLKGHNKGLFRVNDVIVREKGTACSDNHGDGEADLIKRTDLRCWYQDVLEKMEKDEEENMKKIPQKEEFLEIATCLESSNEIWLLGSELGINRETMVRLKEGRKESTSDFIYHMLSEWKQSKPKNATLLSLKWTILAVHKNSAIDLGSIFRCKATRTQGMDGDAANGMMSAMEPRSLSPETQKCCEHRKVNWKKVAPGERQLMSLAKLVGENWKALGLELHLSDQELEQLQADHSPYVTVVYQMLIVWMKQNSRPTLYDLGNCIATSGVSFSWERVPPDVLEKTGDQADEASEGPEMNTLTGAQGNFG